LNIVQEEKKNTDEKIRQNNNNKKVRRVIVRYLLIENWDARDHRPSGVTLKFTSSPLDYIFSLKILHKLTTRYKQTTAKQSSNKNKWRLEVYKSFPKEKEVNVDLGICTYQQRGIKITNVADTDPRSGAFLPLDPGSVMGKKSGSG
jgi:hypothetical protein